MAAWGPQGTMSFSLWPWLAEASWKANRARFILYCRAGVFYCEDTVTRKQQSLKTKDREEAQALLHARNEALRQPALTWGNLSHFSNAQVPHSLAPEIHGGTADTKPRGYRLVLLTHQGQQDDSATKRHLLRCALGRFPLFRLRLIARAERNGKTRLTHSDSIVMRSATRKVI
jgi:hypothetical protein